LVFFHAELLLKREYFFDAEIIVFINCYQAWVGKNRDKVKKKIDCRRQKKYRNRF